MKYERETCNLLRRLGVNNSYVGFRYTVYGVIRAIANPELLIYISKGLYVEISAEYRTSIGCVERNIRTIISTIVAFREKPKSFSHKLQKSTTFCKLAKNKRAFERYFISYQTPFYLFIIMAHPVCIPVYLKYHNSMPYKFGQDDSG